MKDLKHDPATRAFDRSASRSEQLGATPDGEGTNFALFSDHAERVELCLFDETGQKVSSRTVTACIDRGWAEPWFNNPLKPDWQVCKLTGAGRQALSD